MDNGRDIPPDEDRLNYTPPPENMTNGHGNLYSEDLQEDTAHTQHRHQQHFRINNANQNGIHSRGHYQPYEPMDESSDAIGSIEGRAFASPGRRQQASNATEYYKCECNRLSTFVDWRYQATVRKEDLARNGFVFTGTGDKVRCVYCNGVLRQWDLGDVVEEEHHRNFPQCPFIRGQDVGNVPFNPLTNGHHQPSNYAAPSVRSRPEGRDIGPDEDRCGACRGADQPYVNGHHVDDAVSGTNNSTGVDESQARTYSTSPRTPSMQVEPDRLATFEGWPAQMRQKPKDLAQAGLYYTGDGDKVKCFHCDGLLYNWDPEDDPFVEHARWFPECQYIRLVKGEEFVRDVQSGKIIQDNLMQTPAVLAVLSEGHSVDLVQKAVDIIKKNEGASPVITAEKLLMKVMDLEETDSRVSKTMNGEHQPEDWKSLQTENESLKDKQLCKICMENDVGVIFYPCKHLVCCASCAASIKECPICRKKIKNIDNVYMA